MHFLRNLTVISQKTRDRRESERERETKPYAEQRVCEEVILSFTFSSEEESVISNTGSGYSGTPGRAARLFMVPLMAADFMTPSLCLRTLLFLFFRRRTALFF